MTIAIAAHASARPAPLPAGATIAPVAAARGAFAAALANQRAAPDSAISPPPMAATPGNMLPPESPVVAAPATPAALQAIPATLTPPRTASAPRDKSSRTDAASETASATATAPAAADPTLPDPAAPQWNAVQPPMMTAALLPAQPDIATGEQDSGSQPATPGKTRMSSGVNGTAANVAALQSQTAAVALLGAANAPSVPAAHAPLARGAPLGTAPIADPHDAPTRSADAPATASAPRAAQSPIPHAQTAAPGRPAAAGTATAAAMPAAPALNLVAGALPTLVQPPLSNPAMPSVPIAPRAETPTDFSTLVDSIARARSEGSEASVGSVGVTMSHADFGRVSLQFTPRDDGLSVTLRSADPGFAPAVANAAAASANSDPGSHQPDTSDTRQTTSQNGTMGNGSGQSPDGDARHGARQPAANPSARQRTGGQADDDAGIFA